VEMHLYEQRLYDQEAPNALTPPRKNGTCSND